MAGDRESEYRMGMGELQRFWFWASNEKPDWKVFLLQYNARLSGPEQSVIDSAAAHIRAHATYGNFDRCLEDDYTQEVYESHPEALRDLSLSMHAALEQMRERVPAVEPPQMIISVDLAKVEPETLDLLSLDPKNYVFHNVDRGDFRREYLGEWLRPIYRDEPELQQQALAGSRQSGKTVRLMKLRELFESGAATTHRQKCIRDASEIRDARPCDECLSKPCRHALITQDEPAVVHGLVDGNTGLPWP